MVSIYRKNIFVWTLMVNWMARHTLQTIVLDEITKINTFFFQFFFILFSVATWCCQTVVIDLICNKYTKLYGTFKLKIYLKFVFVESEGMKSNVEVSSLFCLWRIDDAVLLLTCSHSLEQNSRAQILNDSLENQIIWHNYLYCTVTATMRYFE